jgi:NADPH-dependent 2,4-dienoyl-CoA reductase/sulfur reductase-like enzyme
MSSIVITGFGAAGYAALMAIKRCDPRREVVVIDSKEYELMHPCGIPYSLEGVVPAEKLYQNINLAAMKVTRIKARALAIDPGSKMIRTDSPENREVPFGTLILTPGSRPVIPAIPGIDGAMGQGLFTLTNVDDLRMIHGYLPRARKGVVIGAGAIGLEAACALRKHLDVVTVVEMKEHVLPGVLDADMAQLTEEHLAGMGIVLLLGTRVDKILCDDRFSGVQAGGALLDADICICAAGFEPDLTLANSCAIAGGRNGVTVDEMLKTSLPDVFAAGDVVSSR